MASIPLIFIGGPTASGKSALALQIARERNGTIINADAMQVYKDMPLLTAQPSAADKAAAPHELYEITDPAEASSAGKWKTLAEDAIRRTVEANRTPILVGGTGLYFKALFGGLADIPPIPASVREKAETLYSEVGSETFRAALAKHDPDSAARIKPNDRQRLIRAYEVVVHTGKPLGAWHEADSAPHDDNACSLIGLTFKIERHLIMPPRDVLYAACDQRFTSMIKHGALKEAETIASRFARDEGFGLRELMAVLVNEISLQEAIVQAQQATRNYAKRQMTWFRNQWPKA